MSNDRVQLTVNMDRELRNAIKKKAIDEGKNTSQLVVELIENYLKE